MEANELRLGNYIYYLDKETILTVDSVGSNGFSSINENGIQYGSDDVSDYNGIELTEEWLLNLGFSMNNETSFKIDNILIYLGQFGKNIVYLIKDLKDDEEIGDVNYIHQLQNLFFALEGKELTLKEN